MKIFALEGAFLHWCVKSFPLSHQLHLCILSCNFVEATPHFTLQFKAIITHLLQIFHDESDTQCSDVIDGSNESLYHADEEMDPLVKQNFSPSQTIFKNFDVAPLRKNTS